MVCGTHSYALAAIAAGYIANMTGANKRYASDRYTSADFQRADYGISYHGQDNLSAAADLLGAEMSILGLLSQREDSTSYFRNTASNDASVPAQNLGTMGSYSAPSIRFAGRRKKPEQKEYMPLLDPPVAVYFIEDKAEFIPAWTESDKAYKKESAEAAVPIVQKKQSSAKQNLVRLIRRELAEPEPISKGDLSQKIRQELSEDTQHHHPALVLYNKAA